MPVGRSPAACSGVSRKSRVRAGAGSSGIAAAIERRSWWRAAQSSHVGDEGRGTLELGARRVARGVRGDQLEVVTGVLAVGQVGHVPSLTADVPDRFPRAQGARARRRATSRAATSAVPANTSRIASPSAGPVPGSSVAAAGRVDRVAPPRRRSAPAPRPGRRLERRVARRRGELGGGVGAGRCRRIGGLGAGRVDALRLGARRSRRGARCRRRRFDGGVAPRAVPPPPMGSPPEATRTPTMPSAARPVPSGVANENRGPDSVARRPRMPDGRSPAACSGVSRKSRVRAGAGSSGIAAAIERRSWWRAAQSSHVGDEGRGTLELGARRVARGVRGDQLEVVIGVLAVGQVGHQSPSPRNRPIESSSRSRSASRPRWIRDFTVPSETPVRSAISW